MAGGPGPGLGEGEGQDSAVRASQGQQQQQTLNLRPPGTEDRLQSEQALQLSNLTKLSQLQKGE